MTCWQGERDTITALTREEAMELYETLPEHYVEYEEAFDAVVEEAGSSAGRPALYDEPMKQAGIWLKEKQIVWGKTQPGGLSETVRRLIDEAMANGQKI